MKPHLLILLVFLMMGCGNDAPDTNANADNLNRARRTPTSQETPQMDKEKETRLLAKIQEFVTVNYEGWALKGTSDLTSSPIELHIIRGSEEKLVKVNYKELNDLDGQPYIVISQFSESDLTNSNTGSIEPKTDVNTTVNTNVNK